MCLYVKIWFLSNDLHIQRNKILCFCIKISIKYLNYKYLSKCYILAHQTRRRPPSAESNDNARCRKKGYHTSSGGITINKHWSNNGPRRDSWCDWIFDENNTCGGLVPSHNNNNNTRYVLLLLFFFFFTFFQTNFRDYSSFVAIHEWENIYNISTTSIRPYTLYGIK